MKKKPKDSCVCGEPAAFFHSGCCNAHMEGKLSETGEHQIVCEKCGKYIGTLKR